MIGLLAISYTQNIGIKFLMTSLNVAMWSLGFILTDLFLNYLGNEISASLLSCGLAGIAAEAFAWPAALGAMFIAAIVPTFLYLATPMAVASLMSGANAGAAAAWGGLSNMSQTAQQATRGSEMLKAMQMQSALNPTSQNTASSDGSIQRPPNPIV